MLKTLKYLQNKFFILDQPATDYQVQVGASPEGRVISKYDLGKFLVDCLAQPEYYGKVCGICTKR